MTWRRLAGWSLILAPVGQISGWTFMRIGGNEGVEPWTTVAHSVWLIGFVMLASVCVELYRRVGAKSVAGRLLAKTSLTVSLLSVAASIGEMIVDLYVGFATSSKAQMDELSEQMLDIPGVEMIFFGFGTQLVYLGFLALIIQLAVLKRVGAVTLLLVLATLALFVTYELLDGPGRQALMPLAVLCMWLALAPLGRRLLIDAAHSRDSDIDLV